LGYVGLGRTRATERDRKWDRDRSESLGSKFEHCSVGWFGGWFMHAGFAINVPVLGGWLNITLQKKLKKMVIHQFF